MNVFRMLLCVMILTIVGCAASTGPGSKVWYDRRMAELESAYQKKELSTAEYLAAKNDVDRIQAGCNERDDSRVHTSFGLFHGF